VRGGGERSAGPTSESRPFRAASPSCCTTRVSGDARSWWPWRRNASDHVPAVLDNRTRPGTRRGMMSAGSEATVVGHLQCNTTRLPAASRWQHLSGGGADPGPDFTLPYPVLPTSRSVPTGRVQSTESRWPPIHSNAQAGPGRHPDFSELESRSSRPWVRNGHISAGPRTLFLTLSKTIHNLIP